MLATDPISQLAIHTKVREVLEPLLSSLPKKILDAAAGNGYLTEWLISRGATVTPFDISREDWRVPAVQCRYSDFNQRIDADDDYFDISVSIETIEHLENPFQFIRELGRVTKPTGIVLITTPNVHSIRSRIKYLFSGMPTLFEYTADDHMGQHISPVSIGQFLYAFKSAKLVLGDLYTTGPKSSVLVDTILGALNHMMALGIRALKSSRKADFDHFLNVLRSEQIRELNRDVSLIVVARKRG